MSVYTTPQRKISNSSPSSSSSSSSTQITPLLHHSPHLSPIVSNRVVNSNPRKSAPSPLLLTNQQTSPRLPGIAEVSHEDSHSPQNHIADASFSFSYNDMTFPENSLSFLHGTPLREEKKTKSSQSTGIERAPLQSSSNQRTPVAMRRLHSSEAGETLNSISLLADDFLIEEFQDSFAKEKRGLVGGLKAEEDRDSSRVMETVEPLPRLNLLRTGSPPKSFTAPAIAKSEVKEAADRAVSQELSEERASNRKLVAFIQEKYSRFQTSHSPRALFREDHPEEDKGLALSVPPARPSELVSKTSPKPLLPAELRLAAKTPVYAQIANNSERIHSSLRSYSIHSEAPSPSPAPLLRASLKATEASSPPAAAPLTSLPIGGFFALILDEQQHPVLVPVKNSPVMAPTSPPALSFFPPPPPIAATHAISSSHSTSPSPSSVPPSAPRYFSSEERGQCSLYSTLSVSHLSLCCISSVVSPSAPSSKRMKSLQSKTPEFPNPHSHSHSRRGPAVSPVRVRFAKYDTSSEAVMELEEQEEDRREPQGGWRRREYAASNEFEQFSEIFYSAPLDSSMRLDRQYRLVESSLHHHRSSSPLLEDREEEARRDIKIAKRRWSSTPTKTSASFRGKGLTGVAEIPPERSDFWRHKLLRRDFSSLLSPPKILR